MSEKFRCERAILFSNLFIFLGAFVVPGFSVCATDRLSWHYIASIDSSEVWKQLREPQTSCEKFEFSYQWKVPPRTTFALADRQKDSCLHPSRPKRNIIQKEKAGNAPSLVHEKGHRQTDRQTHRQTTTTLIAPGPPLRGDPYFVCISTTLLRNKSKISLTYHSNKYGFMWYVQFKVKHFFSPYNTNQLLSSTAIRLWQYDAVN